MTTLITIITPTPWLTLILVLGKNCVDNTKVKLTSYFQLKYGSEEKGSSFCKCSIFLGFLMSRKQERLRSELLSEHKITNLLGFLT